MDSTSTAQYKLACAPTTMRRFQISDVSEVLIFFVGTNKHAPRLQHNTVLIYITVRI